MKIKAAIIGMGIGQKHLESIENYKGSKVTILCDKNPKKIKALKKKYPDKLITSNAEDIFKNKSINLVSIASYDNFHYSQIIKSLNSNKHVIVEKPLCLNIYELKKIIKLVDKKKLKITSNLPLRTVSLFKKIKSKINLNKVFYIEADYIYGRLHKLFQWRSKIKNYSLTLGAGIHMIDLIMWLLNLKPISVYSTGNSLLTTKSKFKKKSFILNVFKFPNDIIVKITSNSTNSYQHMHDLRIFEKNKTILNSIFGSYKINKNKKITKLPGEYPDKKSRKKLIQSFLNNILNNSKPLINFQDQKNLMSVCFAADKSLKTQKEIKIKYY